MKNMNTVDNSLALTIRKEQSLIVVNKVAKLSKKVIFAVFALNILNLIV